MKKILTACLSLLVAIMAQAQGSWVAPQFPGAEMPAGANGTTTYGLCNIETGAFALAGMNWSTHAISQRLLNSESTLPNEQKVKVTNSGGKLKFSINGKTFLGGGTGVNDLWVDHAQNNEWTPTLVETGVYTLSNAGGDLDVLWANGGPLTPNGGVGKTKWGLIKEEDIVNGQYSLYKAKVQLYGLYKACHDAGCVEVYPEAFAAALNAYNAANATAASIKEAYVTLFKAVYMAVDDQTWIDASPLFTNADMCASGNCAGWNIDKGISWSVFESYWDANFSMTQTQTLPAGKYSATLHAFARIHGSDANPTFSIASGNNSYTMNVKYISDVDFGTVSGNGGGFNGNKPNNMQSGGVAICHGDLEYSTEFISVSEGEPVTITMYKPGAEQWMLWQDIKLTYKGMTDAELTAMMADKIAVAQNLTTNQLDNDVLSALNAAIAQASGGTRAQILQSGPVLDAAIDAARANITTRETARQKLVASLDRFEADYNDGANGALRKMSAEAWATLLDATKAASHIKDFGRNIGSETVLSATEMETAATTFNAAMDAAEPSIALYSKYALLYKSLSTLNPAQFPAEIYNTAAVQATDASVVQAIDDMNTAFAAYKNTLEGNQNVTTMAGENMGFESAQGNRLNGNAYMQSGWTMTYIYGGSDGNKQYETFTTETDDLPEGVAGTQALHMRNRWAGNTGVAQITKTFALPAGNYGLSMWIKYVKATTGSLCYYEVDGQRTAIKAVTGSWTNVSHNIELDHPAVVTLSLGVSGGKDMDVYVDDINITLYNQTVYERTYNSAYEMQGIGSTAIASVLAEFPATQDEAEAAGCDIDEAIAVINNAIVIANANDVATSLLDNADFSGGVGTMDATGGGVVNYPAGWVFTRDFAGWNDCKVTDGVFNMWAGTINTAILSQQISNLPDGIYEISAEFKNDIHDGKSGIGLFADNTGTGTSRSIDVGTGQSDDFYTEYVYAEVKGHKTNVGVFSNKGYYQLKNIQIRIVANNADNQAKVGNCRIYQSIAFNRSALEYDFTKDAALAAAKGADVKAMLTQPNALYTALAGQLNCVDNVIVDGTCAHLTLTDKAPFGTSVDFTASTATYERAMTSTWGTVMLPYTVSSNSDVKYYTLSKVVAGENGYMLFDEAETLPANTPGVFVKQDDEAVCVTLSASNADVKAMAQDNGTLDTNVDGWMLNGTYEPLNLDATTASDIMYYIASDKFWHATGVFEVNPFRAWFTTANDSEVRSFRLVIGGSEDGIQFTPASDDAAAIYTLSGVMVQQPLRPGIYIINNHKTVVK